MTKRDEMIQIYSDYHKMVYGIRPRYNYASYTLEQLEADFERFEEVCEENAKYEAIRLAKAWAKWDALVDKTIHMGAGDYETALKWIVQSYEGEWDMGYIMFQNGLSQYSCDRGRALYNDLEKISQKLPIG